VLYPNLGMSLLINVTNATRITVGRPAGKIAVRGKLMSIYARP